MRYSHIHFVLTTHQPYIYIWLVCGEHTGAVVLWQPSHHPGGCCTLVVVEERPPTWFIKRFGCTTIHYKALYKRITHSYIWIYGMASGWKGLSLRFIPFPAVFVCVCVLLCWMWIVITALKMCLTCAIAFCFTPLTKLLYVCEKIEVLLL